MPIPEPRRNWHAMNDGSVNYHPAALQVGGKVRYDREARAWVAELINFYADAPMSRPPADPARGGFADPADAQAWVEERWAPARRAAGLLKSN